MLGLVLCSEFRGGRFSIELILLLVVFVNFFLQLISLSVSVISFFSECSELLQDWCFRRPLEDYNTAVPVDTVIVYRSELPPGDLKRVAFSGISVPVGLSTCRPRK